MIRYFFVFVAIATTVLSNAQVTPEIISQKIKQKGECITDAANIKITNQYKDPSTKLRHVYFTQLIEGIEVWDAASSIHLDKNDNIAVAHNFFICEPERLGYTTRAKIANTQAIEIAAQYKNVVLPILQSKNAIVKEDGSVQFSEGAHLSTKPYYVRYENTLKLVWNCEVYNNETQDWWQIRVDANTGEILGENNWTTHCDQHDTHSRITTPQRIQSIVVANQAKNFHKKTSGSQYRVFPMPIESPNHGLQQLVSVLPDSVASPFGWHDTDGVLGADFTITRGNNVFAKEDTLARNGIGYSPEGGAELIFDFPYQENVRARLNLDAAITNLFYWNNVIHDVFYRYGFNEVSGNFQSNNYGNGGQQRDPVHADAQDGSGTNNANFQTPPDGTIPRMQMFLWNPPGTVTNRNVLADGALIQSVYANFGPRANDTLRAQLVIADDSTSNPTLACSAIKNDVAGKIVLIDRGTCNFVAKALNAQNAGAIAMLLINNADNATAMTGSGNINIPCLMIPRNSGVFLKNKILNGDSIGAIIFNTANSIVHFDSDFDNGVIVHEYGHGISIRLAGGPQSSNCLTGQEQAGEGWSDFFALCLTAKPSDSLLSGRGVATWLAGQNTNGVGIRNFRYSRNMTINPTTYNSIRTLSVPHGVGSVWTTMLYDIYWDMVDKYGFNEDIYDNENGGNNMTLQLVVDALKIQRCNPGFVDLRNSIIAADSLRYGGANRELLWRAFARRGLGASANQGLTSSNTDGTEAFDLPEGIYPVSLREEAWQVLRIWPNPASKQLNIAMPDGVIDAKLEIMDISGKVVLSNQISTNGSSSIQINIDRLKSGVYLIRVDSEDRFFQTKLIITN
jgi:extracellular elastinolytic metalloproteinase